MYMSISEGYVPQEMEKLVQSLGISIVVEDKREEEYQETSTKSRFAGKGNKLSSSMYLFYIQLLRL